MAPIRKGDGTGLDAKGYSQVRKGDGTVLWNAIPDSDVYLHDDFGDGKLQNRDDSGTTTYNGVEGVYRPEWTIDNGTPTVTNERLDYSEGDSGYTEINLDLAETTTWELSNLTLNTAGDQLSYFGLFYEDNPTRSTSDFPPTLYPGYAIGMREADSKIRLIRTDSDGSSTNVINASGTSNNMNLVKVTRESDGTWTMVIDGTEVGTASDATHTNPQYIDFAGRTGPSDNQLLVDELKVF